MSALDDLLSLSEQVKKLTGQRDSLNASLEEAQRHVQTSVQEASRQAQAILQQANDSANQLLQDAQARQKDAGQRLADVEIREHAVAGVDEQLKALAKREEDLAYQQKALEEAQANARAEQQLWVARNQELTVKADALAVRETELASKNIPSEN